MRLSIFLWALFLILNLLSSPTTAATVRQLKIEEGHLELGPQGDELSLVSGDWRFA